LAGQLELTRDGSLPDAVEDQFDQALNNILVILQSQGGSADDVVKLTFYYPEESADRTRHSRALRAMFGERRPPITLIRVVGLADPKYKVEVGASAPGPAPLSPQFEHHQQQRRRMHGQVEDIERPDQCTLDQKAQFLDQMRLGCDRRNGQPARQQQQPKPRQAVKPDQHGWTRASRQWHCLPAASRAEGVSMCLPLRCARFTTSLPAVADCRLPNAECRLPDGRFE